MAGNNLNSPFLFVAYSVAVVSVLLSFGLAAAGDASFDRISGAVVALGNTCQLSGELFCHEANTLGQKVNLHIENTLNEPLFIRSVQIGECSVVDVDERIELGGAGVLQVESCFVIEGTSAPLSIVTEGVISGTTRISSGRIQHKA